MGFEQRLEILQKIEEVRKSKVICYLTSLRLGVPAQMADDAVRVVFDHLLGLPSRPIERLDVFLVSNGGVSTVPWRFVALFREFAKSLNVLVPYRAYSAATLLALGADEIVMHPFAELGPIDPTVSNDFNPTDQQGRRLGISVEDVRAYISFIKQTVGITHEDELIKAIEILVEKAHPLALGNVERFVSQSRMAAQKILKTHMKSESDEHLISEIVETLTSKLFFHGHPINRQEAKEDLRLKVNLDVPPELETLMWNLYLDYEKEFKNSEPYTPASDLAASYKGLTLPAAGASFSPIYATLAVDLIHAMVESLKMSDVQRTSRRLTLYVAQPGQQIMNEEVLKQEWTRRLAP